MAANDEISDGKASEKRHLFANNAPHALGIFCAARCTRLRVMCAASVMAARQLRAKRKASLSRTPRAQLFA